LVAEKVAGPVSGFAGLWESWQNIKISRQRLGDILTVDMEPFNELPLLDKNLVSDLQFDNVSFEYQSGIPILNDFSATAAAQSLTLVIGPSGIGKSTFGRLASGIESPTSGAILLGGANIAAHEPHGVRTKIAYVPQEPYLFSGSIRENLKIGIEDASEEALWAALKVAAADQMVERMPNGLDTDVGERGAALSGGQRQRIAMARSLLHRPKVLVLDEPTSALDGAAQTQMVEEIEGLRDQMTVIVITHRPDVFTGADQVIDFEAFR
jgi:subfamily B ATP-binding cassette protein HlyB/CyaB